MVDRLDDVGDLVTNEADANIGRARSTCIDVGRAGEGESTPHLERRAW